MRARYIAALLVALFAVLTLLDRFVLIELLVMRTAVPILFALVTAAAMIGTGALLRRSRTLDVPLDLLIGYPVFGTLCFLVGTLKIATWTMTLLQLAGVAVAVWLFLHWYGNRAEEARETRPSTQHRAALFAVVTVLACGFVAAQAPPSSLDELTYHLAVPHTWVLEGRAVELPLSSHSYFPMGVESADLPALVLLGATAGGVASHFLHLFAAIATTLLIARRTSSWLATAAIVTTPALAIVAGWSLVDWPLAGAFVALYISLADDDVKTATAATAAGLLVKYTFAPFALVAWAIRRRLPQWPALLGLVFFIRNLVLTGNPFAPFFTAGAPHVSGYRALALADYVFQGTFVDEAVGASIVAMPLFATGAVAIAGALLALALFFLAPSSRILVPFLVPAAMSAAPELRRRVFASLIVLAVVVQTFLVIWFTARSGAFGLLAGTVGEEDYLRKQRPAYAAIEFVNHLLPKESRTLVVGSGETYWFARPVRGGGNFDGPRVSRYLEVQTPEALRERLRRDGITHVALLSTPIATHVEQKVEERQTTLSPTAQRMLAQTLDRYAVNVTSQGNATLFTLR